MSHLKKCKIVFDRLKKYLKLDEFLPTIDQIEPDDNILNSWGTVWLWVIGNYNKALELSLWAQNREKRKRDQENKKIRNEFRKYRTGENEFGATYDYKGFSIEKDKIDGGMVWRAINFDCVKYVGTCLNEIKFQIDGYKEAVA